MCQGLDQEPRSTNDQRARQCAASNFCTSWLAPKHRVRAAHPPRSRPNMHQLKPTWSTSSCSFCLTSSIVSVGSTCKKIVVILRFTRTYIDCDERAVPRVSAHRLARATQSVTWRGKGLTMVANPALVGNSQESRSSQQVLGPCPGHVGRACDQRQIGSFCESYHSLSRSPDGPALML